jgi:hypothetical protein
MRSKFFANLGFYSIAKHVEILLFGDRWSHKDLSNELITDTVR